MNVVQIFVNQRKPSKQQATINKGRTTEKGRERERETGVQPERDNTIQIQSKQSYKRSN